MVHIYIAVVGCSANHWIYIYVPPCQGRVHIYVGTTMGDFPAVRGIRLSRIRKPSGTAPGRFISAARNGNIPSSNPRARYGLIRPGSRTCAPGSRSNGH
jgi:hypothetical protein